MGEDPELARLLVEAEDRPLGGWDFGWLGERIGTTSPPWDFQAIVERRARESPDLLDLGTGGGEWLSGLRRRPPRTVATEPWKPNVAVARSRLEPLGVSVVEVEAAPDNVDQASDEPRLPFRPASFSLVLSRHESYVPSEVARVLAPGGRFLTQQLGTGRYDDLHEALGVPARPASRGPWTLALAVEQLHSAGLRVIDSAEAELETSFADVGALAWFLKAAPWVVPHFSLREHRAALAELHRRIAAEGPYVIREPSFWLEAVRS